MSVIDGRVLSYLLFALTLWQSCFDYDCVDKRLTTHHSHSFPHCGGYHKVWPREGTKNPVTDWPCQLPLVSTMTFPGILQQWHFIPGNSLTISMIFNEMRGAVSLVCMAD